MDPMHEAQGVVHPHPQIQTVDYAFAPVLYQGVDQYEDVARASERFTEAPQCCKNLDAPLHFKLAQRTKGWYHGLGILIIVEQ